jgi:hypothetical protein
VRQVNLKKYVLPNLPYLFVGLYATKLGQAWRLSSGMEFADKVLHLMDGFATAFQSAAPSFHPSDLLVGLCCGAGLRLAVYIKGKNAKKYRHGTEYGSARWGTAKDIQPFVDPVFENNAILTQTEQITMNNRPKDPKTARNKNFLIIGGSGSGKTRFWLKPNLMQCDSETYPCSFVVTDPKGSIVVECGKMLRRKGYRIKIMNTINFKKSHHYNPFSYIHSEKDILKLVNCLIVNTKGEGGKSGDDFWLKAEMLLYTALIGYIHYEAPEEEQNFSTLLEMINAMEVREDDEEFKNAVDLMFDELKERDPGHFAVRQYAKYKLAAGVVCSKRLLNQAVGKSLRTHNLKPKKGAQVMRKNEKITALYERLSRDDFGKDDDQQRESNSISNQELLCRGWFLPPNTYDCGSFVVNGTAVVGKEAKSLITAANQHKKELIYMKSIFEQMGGTYRQEGDYLIPNLALPEEPEYQIGKYGRMRRSYLKEHRPVLYANLLTSGTLHRHLAEIDQACNERMEIIVSDMARQEDVTEALKAADQME